MRPVNDRLFIEVQLLRDLCADIAARAYSEAPGIGELDELFRIVACFDKRLLRTVWADPRLITYYGEVLREVAKVAGNLINPEVQLGKPMRATKTILSLREQVGGADVQGAGGTAGAFHDSAEQDGGRAAHREAGPKPGAPGDSAPQRMPAEPERCREQVEYIIEHHRDLLDRALNAIHRLDSYQLRDPFLATISWIIASVYNDQGGSKTLAPPLSARERATRGRLFARTRRRLGAADLDQDQFAGEVRLLISLNYATPGDHSNVLDQAVQRGIALLGRNRKAPGHFTFLLTRSIRECLVAMDISGKVTDWSETIRKIDSYASQAAKLLDMNMTSGQPDEHLAGRLEANADICGTVTRFWWRADYETKWPRPALLPPSNGVTGAKFRPGKPAPGLATRKKRLGRRLTQRWRALAVHLEAADLPDIGLGVIVAFCAADLLLDDSPTVWEVIIDILSRHELNYEEIALERNKDALASIFHSLLISPRASAHHALRLIEIFEARGLSGDLQRNLLTLGEQYLPPEATAKLRVVRTTLLDSLLERELGAQDPQRTIIPTLWAVEIEGAVFGSVDLEKIEGEIDLLWSADRTTQAVRRRRIALRGIVSVVEKASADFDSTALSARLGGVAPLASGVSEPAAGYDDEDVTDHDLLLTNIRLKLEGAVARKISASVSSKIKRRETYGQDFESLGAMFERSRLGTIAAALAASVCWPVLGPTFIGAVRELAAAPDLEEGDLQWMLPPPFKAQWAAGTRADLGVPVSDPGTGPERAREWPGAGGHPHMTFRQSKLACYPEAAFVELGFGLGSEVIAALNFLRTAEEVFLLSGASLPIHTANQKTPIRLDTAEQAIDYLAFFCGSVHGEDGAFTLIPDRQYLDQFLTGAMTESEPLEIPPVHVERRDGGWFATAAILYGHGLFNGTFTIARSGLIEMLSDEAIIGGGLPVRLIRYVDQWRVEKQAEEG